MHIVVMYFDHEKSYIILILSTSFLIRLCSVLMSEMYYVKHRLQKCTMYYVCEIQASEIYIVHF